MSIGKSQILLFTVGICLVAFPLGSVGGAGQSDRPISEMQLRLTPKTRTVRAGDELEVRAEIWNVGAKALFIERNIYEPCADSPLQLRFEGPTPMQEQAPGVGCASDCMDDPKQPFASRLTQRWILLSAGDFYGTTIRLDSKSFPQLHTPGRWLLHGSYKSDGNLSASFCVNNLTLDPQEVEKLSSRAWKGQSEASVSIVVTRPR